MPSARLSPTLRVLFILLWTGLMGLAAVGVVFAALTVAGAIQFAVLDCGPRGSWGETIYTHCSDIDETQPIFFTTAVASFAPVGIALLILRLSRRGSALFEQSPWAVIGKIMVAVFTAAALWFCWLVVSEIRLTRSYCPSDALPDPCVMRWASVYLTASLVVIFLLPLGVFVYRRLRH